MRIDKNKHCERRAINVTLYAQRVVRDRSALCVDEPLTYSPHPKIFVTLIPFTMNLAGRLFEGYHQDHILGPIGTLRIVYHCTPGMDFTHTTGHRVCREVVSVPFRLSFSRGPVSQFQGILGGHDTLNSYI